MLVDDERAAEQTLELAVIRRNDAVREMLRMAPEVAALWGRFETAQQKVHELSWALSAVGIHRLPKQFHWDGLLRGPRPCRGRRMESGDRRARDRSGRLVAERIGDTKGVGGDPIFPHSAGMPQIASRAG
jgi:hypothetical protein